MKELQTVKIKEFILEHELSDMNSNVMFNAQIKLTTEKNYKEIESEVMIRFDGFNSFGKLTILGSDLDPYDFPEEFEAKWQNFEYKNGKFLEITGNHPSEKIGRYTVLIYPIKNDEI